MTSMLSTSSATEPNYDKTIRHIPIDIDNEPIKYKGNPANMNGTLDNLCEYYKRNGYFTLLLETNTKLLPNSKLAIDHSNMSVLVTNKDDVNTYGFYDPCPPSAERIERYNATQVSRTLLLPAAAGNQAQEDTAEDTPAAVAAFNVASFGAFVFPTQAESTALEKRTQISPDTIAAYNREFVQSILHIFDDTDMRAEFSHYTTAGDIIKALKEIENECTSADKLLVNMELQNYMSAGLIGQLTFDTFNAWIKKFYKLHRYVAIQDRLNDDRIQAMMTSVIMSHKDVRDNFEQRAYAEKPQTSARLLKMIRDMLRKRKVFDEIDSTKNGMIALSVEQIDTIISAGVNPMNLPPAEAVALYTKLTQAGSDPRKNELKNKDSNKGTRGAYDKPGIQWPKDECGNVREWVQGMPPCGCTHSDGGKHLRRNCPLKKWENTPMGTKKTAPIQFRPRQSANVLSHSSQANTPSEITRSKGDECNNGDFSTAFTLDAAVIECLQPKNEYRHSGDDPRLQTSLVAPIIDVKAEPLSDDWLKEYHTTVKYEPAPISDKQNTDDDTMLAPREIMDEIKRAVIVEDQSDKIKADSIPTSTSKPTTKDVPNENTKTASMSHFQKYSTTFNIAGLLSIIMIVACVGIAIGMMIGTASTPIMTNDVNINITAASYDEEPYAVDLQRSLVASSKELDYANNQGTKFGVMRIIGVMSSFLVFVCTLFVDWPA